MGHIEPRNDFSFIFVAMENSPTELSLYSLSLTAKLLGPHSGYY